jgi:methionyl-tRNA synthetase
MPTAPSILATCWSTSRPISGCAYQRMRGNQVHLRLRRRCPRHRHHAQGRADGHHARGDDRHRSQEHQPILPTSTSAFDNYHSTHSRREPRASPADLWPLLKESGKAISPPAPSPSCSTRKRSMFLPTASSRAPAPSANPRTSTATTAKLRRHLQPDRADRPEIRDLRRHPGDEGLRALLLQAADFEAELLKSGCAAAPSPGRGGQQDAAEWFESGLQEWDITRDAPYFGFRDPRRAGQVLLRLAGCAHRLHGQLQEPVRQARPGSISTATGARTPAPSSTTSSARTSSTSTPVLAGHAGRRNFRKPTKVNVHGYVTVNGAEDVQIARHLHQGAHLPRPPGSGVPALLLRRQARPRIDDLDLNLEDFVPGQCRPGRQAGQHRQPLRRLSSTSVSTGKLAGTCPSRSSGTSSRRPRRASPMPTRPASSAAPCAKSWRWPTSANRYMDDKAPWVLAKQEGAGCTGAGDLLRGHQPVPVLMLYLKPVLPHLAERCRSLPQRDPLLGWRGQRR